MESDDVPVISIQVLGGAMNQIVASWNMQMRPIQ